MRSDGGSVIRLVKRKAKSARDSGLSAIESTAPHGKILGLVLLCIARRGNAIFIVCAMLRYPIQ